VLAWLCLERGADLHMAQLMPLPLTVSCFSKIQIGFAFLVPAYPGRPGQRAVKRVCVRACVRACVCVCVKSASVQFTYRKMDFWMDHWTTLLQAGRRFCCPTTVTKHWV